MRDMRPDELERAELVKAGGTVTANLKRDAALVAWATERGLAVRIDRRTRWGNPYLIERGKMKRADVIAAYAQHFARLPHLHRDLGTLRGKVLVCWCYPERCHGDVLIDALRSATTAQDAR